MTFSFDTPMMPFLRSIYSSSRALRIALLPLVFVGALVASGCQDAVEPEDAVIPVEVVIRVADEGGRPIGGAAVEFGRLGDMRQIGVTGDDGSVVLSDVPIEVVGATFESRITLPSPAPGNRYLFAQRVAPTSSAILDPFPIRDSVFLGCTDTRIVYRVAGSVPPTPCNDSRTDELSFDFCLEDRSTDTLCTPFLSHTCPAPLAFTLPSTGIPGLTLTALALDGTPLGSTFTVDPGESYRICATYTATTPERLAVPPIVITGSGSGSTVTEELEIDISVDNCIACECPDNGFRIAPSGTDTVCVGDEGMIDVDLSNVVNTSDPECSWKFEQVFGFNSPDISVAVEPQTLPGGNRRLGEMRIRFRPTTAASYVDSVVYKIVRVNSSTDEELECPERLTILFRGQGGTRSCRIDSAASSIFVLRNGRFVVDPMLQCVDFAATRTIVFANDGACAVSVDGRIQPNAARSVFTLDPDRRTVDPRSSDTFTVFFSPTSTSVWPNGRFNGPGITRFTGYAELQTDCGIFRIDLTGDADTNCRGSRTQILHAWGAGAGRWFEGIFMGETTNGIQYENDNVAQGNNLIGRRHIYVESIDLAGTSAVLNSDGTRWARVDNRVPSVSGETACDIASNYLGSCGSGVTGPLGVNLWDVIVFTLPGSNKCGIIWVRNVDNDAAVNGTPAITIQICYPI